MTKNDKEKLELLDTRLDEKTTKTMIICSVIMLVAVLIHDGDHIRQAYNWGYTIPMSLWALNLIVYVLPVVSIFLAKSRRMSATIVCCLMRHRDESVFCRAPLLRLIERPQLGHLELYIL